MRIGCRINRPGVRCLTRQRGEPKAERGGMLILLLMTKRENERKPKYVVD
jgi:hypothetical protein